MLANVGFKDATTGAMRQEFVPVRDVEVRIRVPQGRKVVGVELMRAGQKVSYRLHEGYAVATLPTLHIAEVLHLQLS
jgi:hypothetical protein